MERKNIAEQADVADSIGRNGSGSGIGDPADALAYEAFISYSHTEADARVAREIQRFIEGFSVPRALREQAGRSHLGKVFRDEDELTAGTSLSAGLEEALRAARWLIVVCSPAAAESPWVAREIESFIAMHGCDRVLAVLASGEPTEAFPAALASDVGLPGESSEPIAADLRSTVLRVKRRAELLRLAAPIVGCSYDDLVQRQRVRRRRRMAAMTAVACACLAVVGVVVYSLQHRAMRTEEIATAERARQEALETYNEGDRIEALRLALDGVAPGDDPVQKAEAQYTLAETLGVYHELIDTKLLYAEHGIADASTLTVSGDGRWFSVVDSSDLIVAYDMGNGSVVAEFRSDDIAHGGGRSFLPYTETAEGYLLATLDDAGLVCYDVANQGIAWEQLDIGFVAWIESFDDGSIGVLAQQDETVSLLIINMKTGSIEQSIEMEGFTGSSAVMGVGNNRVAVVSEDTLYLVDLAGERMRQVPLEERAVTQLVLDDAAVYAVSSQSSAEGCKATLCAYEWEDGSLRWEFDRSWSSYQLEFTSLPFYAAATIYAVEGSRVLGASVLPVVVGSQVLLVDVSTGEVASEVSTDAPIVQFRYLSSSGGEGLSMMNITGARGLALIEQGTGYFVELEGYAFPTYTWYAEEVLADGSRYIVGCSAEQTETIFVYRDDSNVPREPGVEGLEIDGEVSGISESIDHRRVAVYTTNGKVTILDGATFAVETVIDLPAEGIQLQDTMTSLIAFPDGGSDVLVICDPGGGDVPPRAWQFDAATGDLLSAWEWPYAIDGISYDGCVFSDERNGCVTLSFPRGGYLGLIDLTSLETVEEFTVHEVGISDAVLVNDERYLFVYEGGFAGLYDSSTMELVGSGLDGLTFEPECGVAQIAVSPDGTSIATVSPEKGLALIDASTGELRWSVDIDASGKEYVAFSGDGELVMVQDTNGRFGMYDAGDGSLVATTNEVAGLVLDASLSKGGEKLYIHSDDTALRYFQVFDVHQGTLTLIATLEDGWAVSEGGDYVLARSQVLYRQPMYTLEDLVEMAREEIAAHEGQ